MNVKLSTWGAVAALLVWGQAAVGQQNPDGQLPVTTVEKPYLYLIRDPVVHEDLRLTARQREAVAELNDTLDADLWAMRNKSAEHVGKTVQQATATATNRLASILNRDQQRRLWQIEMWTLGTRCLLRDEMAEKLGLSDEQRKEIGQVIAETQEAIAELRKQLQAGQPRDALEEKARKRHADEQKQIVEQLTRRQQQQWTTLLGKRIDVATLGRVKFKAPELRGENAWINSEPLALAQLKGKVVALHFYAFGCINCKRNFPWYQGWHESFADRGLVVLGIQTPETAQEREVENVRRAAQEAGLQFPILHDADKQNWNAWGNSMWPSVYLIDKQGYVRYWWYGELNWKGAEGEKLLRQRIEELLGEDGVRG